MLYFIAVAAVAGFLFRRKLVHLWHKLDDKFLIYDDLYIAYYFVWYLIYYIYTVITNRFQFWYVFKKKAESQPHHKLMVYENETYTYKETFDIVMRLSHILHNSYGINSGDYIAVNYTNKPMFVFLWLALWQIGAIPAFINYNLTGAPLEHWLKKGNCKMMLVDPQVADLARDATNAVVLDEDDIMSRVTDAKYPVFVQEDDIRSPSSLTDYQASSLIFTSGTTGLPKPAIMSWRKSVWGASLFGYIMRIDASSTVFTAMPLYHSTAAVLGVCAVISQGGCVALANKFSASRFWKQVVHCEATHIQYVGEVCRYLLNTPVQPEEKQHCVRYAYGNGLRQDIWMEFKTRFGIDIIGEFYAATESPFATTNLQRGTRAVGACRSYGLLVSWVLSIQQTLVRVDPEDSGVIYRNNKGRCEVPPPGESGELLMRIFNPRKVSSTFQGYMGAEKETDSKVLRDVFRSGDAWFRSGDLLKADNDNFWYFVDRMGDTFRWKSENVAATEVENQILLSQDIYQVVVVGVKVPKHEGRAGFAVIQLHGDVEKLAVLNSLDLTLPKYAWPVFAKFVDQIVTNDSHKIPKAKFRNQVLPSGEDGTEQIYWLYRGEYRELTEADWNGILDGTYKI